MSSISRYGANVTPFAYRQESPTIGEEDATIDTATQAVNQDLADRQENDFIYSKNDIARLLWLDPATLISDGMEQKVNLASSHLKKHGYELQGVLADGNCFCNAFLESYRTLSRKIPLLDAAPDQLFFLRAHIASNVERTNVTRAQEIQRNGEWISASDEGDLLAKALQIPIRIITVNKDQEGCGISDMLTFPEVNKPQQEWLTVDEGKSPKSIF